MSTPTTFEELLAEGESVPVEGWDFSWFEGRATEDRPSWGYSRLLRERVSAASAVVDIQTGGGEVLASAVRAEHPPAILAATESWPPNAEIARRRLQHLGATVVEVADEADLPFPDASFDLVVSRHPTLTIWPEIARVLRPGGSYLSQQVGAGTVHELTDFMMGPQPVGGARSTRRAVAAAEAAGLEVVDLRVETLPMSFNDIGAVVHFLRKVIWIVPDFTVDRYRQPLRDLHEQIQREGPFRAYSRRFLIEARKPDQATDR
ncbi:class I SAM-dependent methyltransferase [Actinopolymorpha alba]|uniref:class I SAM-dependent methyltransferase n=1 Tax=Actinopolymorpha alba TaxID=533267 RepID=UPI00058BBE49|nr:class I SAM-dependent methyltransferase [Actinopolymorpha alba]